MSVSVPSPPVTVSAISRSIVSTVMLALEEAEASMAKAPAVWLSVLSPSPRITVVRPLTPALSPMVILLDPAAARTSTPVMLAKISSLISPSLLSESVSTPSPPRIVSAAKSSTVSTVTEALAAAVPVIVKDPAVWRTSLSPSPRTTFVSPISPAALSPRVTALEPVRTRVSKLVLFAKASSLTSLTGLPSLLS